MQTVKTYDGSYSGEAPGGYVDPVGAAALPDTGVTAGAYGLAGSVPVFTIDAKGRVSAAANVPISITEAQVVGLTADLAAKAPLASPALTGVPTAPTAALGTNTTQISTTAFVAAAIASLVASSPSTLDTLNELATALGNDPNFATTMATELGLKAVDAAVVHKTGLENIAGAKTFTNGINFGTAGAGAGVVQGGVWNDVTNGLQFWTSPGSAKDMGIYNRAGSLLVMFVGASLSYPTFPQGISLGNQVLDVYDYAPWTPTAVNLGGSGITYSCEWIKVGKRVDFSIVISGTALTGTVNSTSLTLPVTPARMSSAPVLNAANTSVGTALIYTDGKLYLPTFTSTTQIILSGVIFLI